MGDAPPAKLSLSDRQLARIQDAVVISGSARSGTSILGRLISTLESIEYHYEPQIVTVLMKLLHQGAISKETAFLLLHLHLHEDLLIESAHGRKVNLRPDDMTLVLNSMSWAELNKRWRMIKGTADAIGYIENRGLRLAFKNAGLVGSMPLLAEALPAAKFVVIVRDGRDVIASQLLKGWLTDEALEQNYWPFKVVDGLQVPTVVDDGHARSWTGMNTSTRACYLWNREAQETLDAKSSPLARRAHFLAYEDLRQDPGFALDEIARFLAVGRGEMTSLALQAITPPAERAPAYDFLDSVETGELERFKALNQQLGYRF